MNLEIPFRGRFDHDRAELWADGIVHAVGIALALVGVGALLASALPAGWLVPALVYGGALLGVLTISAVYNLWPISPVKWWLRRFDHAAIYLLIAGTYTPLLMRMGDDAITGVLLAAVWTAALAGVVLKIALPGRFDRLSIVLCLAIGWSGIVLWDRILLLPSATFWLLAAGAVLYTGGVVFHLWQSLRFQNAIWHAFVLAASACHYGAVLGSVPTGSA